MTAEVPVERLQIDGPKAAIAAGDFPDTVEEEEDEDEGREALIKKVFWIYKFANAGLVPEWVFYIPGM